MGLESATYIDGLVTTNPVGATDPKSQGDDHIRLLKSTVKATFPNLTGAVTATQLELNFIDGVTGVEGTGKIVLANAGVLPALSGISLTALNASNLGSGTVPDARFPATLPAVSGANLTNLNGTNVASGTVADARLSANVPLINAQNVFTGSAPGIAMHGTNQYLSILDTSCEAFMQATSTDVRIGSLSNHPVYFKTNATDRLVISSGGDFNFVSGLVSTTHASAQEVGYQGTPPISMSGNLTATAAHAGGRIYYTGAGGHKYVLPSGTAIPEGTVIRVINFGGGTITINASDNSVTMYLIGAGGSAGDRTLAVYGACTLERITDGGSGCRWMVSGAGLT